MGLINKLKNVLFEDEEVEESPVEKKEEKVIKEKEPLKKKESVKMTFDGDDEEDTLSDRELFKAEPTFNFPVFDEHEFDEVKKEERVDVPNYERMQEVKTRVSSSSGFDVDRGRPRGYESYKEQARKPREVTPVAPVEKKKFTPSPVISPVYGVLDKNYRKEDIVLRSEEKKVIDVDSVRRKAFGTLEDDIEKTLSTPARDFYPQKKQDPKKEKLEEFIEKSADEVIPVTKESKVASSSSTIEEKPVRTMPKKQDELEVLDRPVQKSIEEKLEDETLENDLFDLIDSMYETREDGESF